MPRSARWTDVYWQPSGRAGMERYSAAMAMDRSLSHLSTAQLLAGARAEAVRDDPDAAVPYLVALHDRATQEVFDTAARLLPADDPIDRELGARILRELGRQDETGRRPFSAQAIPLLRHRLDNEPETYLVTHLISALGYNCAREAPGDVLRFADHPDDGVQFTVAAGIPSLINPAGIEPDALDALVRLCHDDDADTPLVCAICTGQRSCRGKPAHRQPSRSRPLG